LQREIPLVQTFDERCDLRYLFRCYRKSLLHRGKCEIDLFAIESSSLYGKLTRSKDK
jgi:hypothetical protein